MNRISRLVPLIFLAIMAYGLPAQAEIKSTTIKYEVGGQPFEGTLSVDDSIKGKRPGVLVVHEWWGITLTPKNVLRC
jgi:hypothetical protein